MIDKFKKSLALHFHLEFLFKPTETCAKLAKFEFVLPMNPSQDTTYALLTGIVGKKSYWC